jgi:hypothetical protein
MRLTVTTYEGASRRPVLRHTFFGRTKPEIVSVVQAHTKTDSFFRAAVTTRNFQGIALRSTWRWSR